jgi:hypothetical protein
MRLWSAGGWRSHEYVQEIPAGAYSRIFAGFPEAVTMIKCTVTRADLFVVVFCVRLGWAGVTDYDQRPAGADWRYRGPGSGPHVVVQWGVWGATPTGNGRRRRAVFVNTVDLVCIALAIQGILRGRDQELAGAVMAGCGDECGSGLEHASRHERHILIIVLLINAAMFVAESSAGLMSGSTALLADSLDMLADAIVYALGLFALGRAWHWRARAALTSGVFQLLLGVGVAVEAIWKTLANGLPDAATMGLFGVIALLANTVCFLLLARFRDGDINLRATWICSRNDIIGNAGVLIAAGMVAWLGSSIPDIVIGLLIAAVVIRSAWRIMVEARVELYGKAG